MKTGLNQTKRQVEVKTAKTILGIVLLFCLSWMPYAIVSLIGVFGGQDYITPATSVIPGILAKCSTIYNPIIYAFWYVFRIIIHGDAPILRLCNDPIANLL